MNKPLSIYLDFIRFFAAAMVVIYHAGYDRFDGGWLDGLDLYGHDAVIMFFVLSGFVIAYVSNNKEKSFKPYMTSRFARLYSVVIPALILTLIADMIGRSIDPSMYVGKHYQDALPILRVVTNLLFLNELWFISVRPFSNGPFWSLPYEFWYYVIYAICFYYAGLKRFILAIVAMLIAGPKILLLFPIWLFGVGVYHVCKKDRLGLWGALAFTIIPLIGYATLKKMGAHDYALQIMIDTFGYDFTHHNLRWSKRFLADYAVGGLFALHIIGMASLIKNVTVPITLEKPIRYLAGMTFALYLFHYPLLQLFGSIVHNGVVIFSLTIISIVLLAPITEGKKHVWKRWIVRLTTRNR